MNNGAAQSSTTPTFTRSGLVCEALAAPVEDGDGDVTDAAELEAEVGAARFDDDPSPYAGNDDDGGFCGGDDW